MTDADAQLNPVTLCDQYVLLSGQIKDLEARKDALKPLLAMLIPEGDKKAAVPAGAGQYVVSKVSQDKRTLDQDKLVVALLDNPATKHAVKTKLIPNIEEVQELIKDGALKKTVLADCMVGVIITYCTVKFKLAGALEEGD